ncbi:MAG: ABC transporter ATP-binding protein [Pseudomonadales bacterium]
MKLIVDFIVSHPWNSSLLVVLLLVAGLADGVGISAMLPMLSLAFDAGGEATAGGDEEGLAGMIVRLVTAVGLTPSIGTLLSVIVIGIGVKSALIFVAEQRIGYLSADVATRLRAQLLRAITASSWQFYVSQSVGRLSNAMATEAWRASNAYVYGVRMSVAFIETLVYFVLALLVSWQATLACLLAGAAVWRISHRFVAISRQAGSGQTGWYRSLLGLLTDLLQSIKSLKAMGRERSAEALVARETLALKGELRREVLGNAGLDAAQEPLYTLVIVAGVYLALVYFSVELATVTFMTLVLARLLKLGSKVQKEYQRMTASESAYWALLDTVAEAERHAEQTGGTLPPKFRDCIRLEHVGFGYGEARVLDDVSIEIRRGEITCLVGGSGTGKSTVADLVIGLIRPDTGRLLVDGVPLAQLDLTAWRRRIGYVPQDNLLLHDSVLMNVTLGDPAISESQVMAALTAAGAAEFVAGLPEGLDTPVGERGARLSGGQRQRIMIARALAHEPWLLILDEATSALDPATEAAICSTLEALKGRVTILTVTHQSAMRELADRVYRVEAGRIAPEPAAPAAALSSGHS